MCVYIYIYISFDTSRPANCAMADCAAAEARSPTAATSTPIKPY